MRRRHTRDPRDGEPVGIDDYTGLKVALSSLKKDWQGFYTVNPDRRNSQDFVRGVADNMALPYARPETPDVFMAQPLLDQMGNVLVDQNGKAILEQGVTVEL